MHCDPISDMLTRIRNAVSVNHTSVLIRASKGCEGIARVLQEQGYIKGYDRINNGKFDELRIDLKYGPLGEKVINHISRYSKTSCRQYSKVSELPQVRGGLGIAVISTNKGVMTDRQCREINVGGEVLCLVY